MIARPPLVAVVGTGTGVGKTFLSCALLRHVTGLGRRAAGRKPVESGVVPGGDTDAAALARAGAAEAGAPPYVFSDPVSPHLAARRVGATVELDVACAWASRDAELDLLLVETAGGLLTPLSSAATNLDLVRTLDPDAIVLVGLDRLGVLHDVGVVRLVLIEAGLWPRTLTVLMGPESPDLTTGGNAPELAWLGWTGDPVTWPRGGVASDIVWNRLVTRSPRFT
jgi:dethiobiotin synthetase